jgi:head-tail adaptor
MTELAGALRERVSIETRANERDIIAGRILRWQYDGAAWAAVAPIMPGDFNVADSASALPRWAVTMRKREGITQWTRLVWRGRFLHVRMVESDPREPSRMVLRCEEAR